MKPKNIFRGISNLFLGGLLAYTLSDDLNAQTQPSPIVKDVNYKVTLVKEDSSAFRESTPTSLGEAGVNIIGWPGRVVDGDTIWEPVYRELGNGDAVSKGVDSSGFAEFDFKIYTPDMLTSFDDEQPLAPTSYRLSSNYPEPFNGSTKVEAIVEEREVADLVVYDILGQEVARKSGVVLPRGRNIIGIDGLDGLANGVYIFTVEGEDFAMAEKMMKTDGVSAVDLSGKGQLRKSYDASNVDISYIGNLPLKQKSYATVRVNGGSEKLLKSKSDNILAYTKLGINAVVPGANTWEGPAHELWIKDSVTGEYTFQDSLEETLLLEGYPSSALGKSSSSSNMNEIERPDMKYNMPKSEGLEKKLKSIRQKYDNIQR